MELSITWDFKLGEIEPVIGKFELSISGVLTLLFDIELGVGVIDPLDEGEIKGFKGNVW